MRASGWPGCQQGDMDSDINCACGFVMPLKLCYKNFHLSSRELTVRLILILNNWTNRVLWRKTERLHVRFPLPGGSALLISSHLPDSFLLLPTWEATGCSRHKFLSLLGFAHPSPDFMIAFPHCYYPDHSGSTALLWGLMKAPARHPCSCQGCGLLTSPPLRAPSRCPW